MSEAPVFIASTLAGVLLGIVFFGGLWWTIRRGVLSRHPAAWFFGSLLLRMAAVLACFYFVSGRDWRRLLACLLGFLLARILVTRLTRAPIRKRSPEIAGGTP